MNAQRMNHTLADVRSFIEGFEGDELQEDIPELLAAVDAASATCDELLPALRAYLDADATMSREWQAQARAALAKVGAP